MMPTTTSIIPHRAAPPDDSDSLSLGDYDAIDADELVDLAHPALPVPPLLPDAAQGAFPAEEPIDEFELESDADSHEADDDGTEYNEDIYEAEPTIDDQDATEGDDDHEENQGAFEEDGDTVDEDNDYVEDPGATEDEEDPGAAQHEEDQGAPEQVVEPERAYNLRDRTTINTRFRDAIDEPHSSKAYYPPADVTQAHQFHQIHKLTGFASAHDKCKFAAHYILTHVTNAMNADAGIKKTQMSFIEGLRRHGKAAEAALMAKFAQLEDLGVYEAVNVRFLSRKQRRAALRAINLIKEKRCGKIKGRTVADGRSQRFLYDKSETASPTIATDALILSIIIDAYEGRDVATADIAGAYLKAYMKDFVLMRFSGETVRILCELNPKHMPHVVVENGEKVLYVRLVKAIYGCVKSALLWYELFSSTLQQMGFVLNPYDPCVANCEIGGKQCTIGWYVDDTKISHVDPAVVTEVIDKLESKFGKMSVVRGDEHVFWVCGCGTSATNAKRPST